MKRDLIVIGGGAGGLVVASGCAQLGMKVTLIEKEPSLGGDCLHYGCVPSKTLIHSAKVAHMIKNAPSYGLKTLNPEICLSAVNQRVQDVIAAIQVHDAPERFESFGVEVIFGQAKFIDKKTIQVCGENLQAKRFVIATGSHPIVPDIDGLTDIEFLTNESIFKLRQLPEHLIVLGGGVVGVELGQAFARLGAKVTVVETGPRLLKMIDVQASECMMKVFACEGMTCEYDCTIEKICKLNEGFELYFEQAGTTKTIQGSHLLLATGRKPSVEALNLDVAGVKLGKRGIQVNKKLKTKNKKIYAVGDVVDSPYKFTHMAEFHAGVVIANVAFKIPKKVKNPVVPAVIFTDPEIAMVGATQKQLDAKKVRYQTLEVPFADNDRALAQNETTGFIKLFVRKKHILGAVMVGPQAGELITEVALAIQAKLPIGQISATIHAYPCLSQIIRRCVNTYYAPKLFSNKTKRLVRFLQKFS